jgi:hypothetical protein
MAGKKPDDNNSKDGVVIQRVIREVGGGSSYLMKVKLKARALWNVIEDGDTNQQEEMVAPINKKR